MSIQLFNCDCMEKMKEYPDKWFELAIVDPPYGIGCAKTINIENIKKGFAGGKLYESKQWDNERPAKVYFDELRRITYHQIIMGGNYFADFLPVSRGWIFWDKKDTKEQGSYFADGELAWTSFDTVIRKFQFGWIGVDYINNRHEEIKQHPTQKPVKLYEWLLKNYAKKGDKILDTHGGSMSSAIACYNLDFDLTLFEIDKDYFNAGNARLEQHMRQQRLFDERKP